MANQNKTPAIRFFWLSGLLILELIIFLLMTGYKYVHNYSAESPPVFQIIKFVLANFDPFFIGNIIWLLIFIISVVSLINMFFNIRRIDTVSINFLVIFSILLSLILIISLLLPSEKTEELTGSILQLNAKGTKILGLSVFTLLYLYLMVSLTIVSFSALKKLYFFRALWLTILTAATGPALVTIFVYNFSDDTHRFENSSQKSRCWCGAGSSGLGRKQTLPVLRERINKCYELYKNSNVLLIVLTGGGSPGELTEAEVSRNELIKKGVDENKIITENRSNSTLEQVSFIKNSLYIRNNWKSVVFISDHFHLFRTKQIAKFFELNAFTVSSDTPISTESTFNYCLKESFAVILFWLFGIG